MNYLQLPLLLLIVLYTASCSVKQETLSDKLVRSKIIEQKMQNDFDVIYQDVKDSSNAGIVRALCFTEMKRVSGIMVPLHDLNPGRHFGPRTLSSKEYEVVNPALIEYSKKLYDVDLISVRQLKLVEYLITKNAFANKIFLLEFLMNQVAYDNWMAKKKLLPYCDKLYTNKVLSESNYKKLQSDINASKIEYHYQLIDYCEKARLFDLATYSDDPAVYLEQIHREVSSLIPGIEFTDFKYSIQLDSVLSDETYKSYDLHVTLKHNGKIYRQKSFINPNFNEKDSSYLGKIDETEFYKIFNKILADQQSTVRLNLIRPGSASGLFTNWRRFGIIALEENQTAMFQEFRTYIEVAYEDYKNALTSDGVNKVILEYKNLGLFRHLSAKQIQRGTEDAHSKFLLDTSEILACFPDIIYRMDLESANLKNPYEDALHQFSVISHNEFSPSEISDNYSEPYSKVTVSFKLKEKLYKKEFNHNGDWMDTEFFTYLCNIAEESQLSGKFYYVYVGGQETCFIFLTPTQYEYCKKNKLISFEAY